MSDTIEDILSEMQETARQYLAGGNDSTSIFEILSTYHDRLEAAYKRDTKAVVDLNEIALKTATDENARLLAENARLKAALKPVLEVHLTQDNKTLDVYDSKLDAVVSVRAVREAQRIYDGGAK